MVFCKQKQEASFSIFYEILRHHLIIISNFLDDTW